MKKYALLLTLSLFSILLIVASCAKEEEKKPCDNIGTLCIENKMDSTVTITLKPINTQFSLQRDYMKCNELPGNQPYTLTIATPSTSRDTIVFILPCDNKLIILR